MEMCYLSPVMGLSKIQKHFHWAPVSAFWSSLRRFLCRSATVWARFFWTSTSNRMDLITFSVTLSNFSLFADDFRRVYLEFIVNKFLGFLNNKICLQRNDWAVNLRWAFARSRWQIKALYVLGSVHNGNTTTKTCVSLWNSVSIWLLLQTAVGTNRANFDLFGLSKLDIS